MRSKRSLWAKSGGSARSTGTESTSCPEVYRLRPKKSTHSAHSLGRACTLCSVPEARDDLRQHLPKRRAVLRCHLGVGEQLGDQSDRRVERAEPGERPRQIARRDEEVVGLGGRRARERPPAPRPPLARGRCAPPARSDSGSSGRSRSAGRAGSARSPPAGAPPAAARRTRPPASPPAASPSLSAIRASGPFVRLSQDALWGGTSFNLSPLTRWQAVTPASCLGRSALCQCGKGPRPPAAPFYHRELAVVSAWAQRGRRAPRLSPACGSAPDAVEVPRRRRADLRAEPALQQVEREVDPRAHAGRGDDLPDVHYLLLAHVHLGELGPERVAELRVGRRRAAVEQPRPGEDERAGADRGDEWRVRGLIRLVACFPRPRRSLPQKWDDVVGSARASERPRRARRARR